MALPPPREADQEPGTIDGAVPLNPQQDGGYVRGAYVAPNTFGFDDDYFHIGALTPGKPANVAVLPDLFRVFYGNAGQTPDGTNTILEQEAYFRNTTALYQRIRIHTTAGTFEDYGDTPILGSNYTVRDPVNDQGGLQGGVEFIYFTNEIFVGTIGSVEYLNDFYLLVSAHASGSEDNNGNVMAPSNGRYLVYKASSDFTGLPTLARDLYFESGTGIDGGFIELLNGQDSALMGANGIVKSPFGSGGSLPPETDISGTAGNDLLNGTGGDDTILGMGGNDTLEGGSGNDVMYGGAGDDVFDWGVTSREGADSFHGGAGNDVYVIGASAQDQVFELSGEGSDLIFAAQSYSLAALPNVEHLWLYGGVDSNLTGNSRPNDLAGNSTANSLNGAGGNDTLQGGGGSDRLLGGGGNDTLIWDAIDSRVDGGAGAGDTLNVSVNLNLLNTPGSKLLNVERVNMTGGSNDTLTVNKAEVLDLSGQSNTLTVLGNAGDRVDLRGAGWRLTSAAGGFETWKSGTAIVKVETDLAVL
jgi:Ca2+-binding RTX toxin-like protein